MTYTATVKNWKNESTGRPTRRWYWQVEDHTGKITAAGIRKGKLVAQKCADTEARLQSGVDYMIESAAD